MLLAGNPQRAPEFLDRVTERHLANLEAYLGAVGDSIDMIVCGDDLGMQQGPQVSPQMLASVGNPPVRFDEREVETVQGTAREAPATERIGNR
jgi:hypothetical protein